jgi:hypothetical protein
MKNDSAREIVMLPRTCDSGNHFEVRRALPTPQKFTSSSKDERMIEAHMDC